MVEEEELLLGDTEKYGSAQDLKYSRTHLLMHITLKILDAGSREMKKGFYQEKKDKFGNIIRTLTDDTRRSYCEAVRTLMDLSSPDFDNDTTEEVERIEKEIEDRKKELLDAELKEWNSFSLADKKGLISNQLGSVKGSFNSEKRFVEQFTLFCLDKYREMFQVLTNLAKEKDYYVAESFEG